jgi:type III secretion system YscQ/HrcQ family protein
MVAEPNEFAARRRERVVRGVAWGAMGVEAYPYQRWPRLSRDQAGLLRGALRALPWLGDRYFVEAEALLGAPVTIVPGVAELVDAQVVGDSLTPPVCVLWLEYGLAARALPLLCSLGPALAGTLVDRVLGGNGSQAHAPGDELDELSAGALAYLAARMCATSGAALGLRAVLTQASTALAQLQGGAVLVWPLALQLAGAHAGVLRVMIPEPSAQALARLPQVPVPASRPPALDALPLRLCAHAARLVLRRGELEQLAPGDVVVPEHCQLARDASGWHGPAELHVVTETHASYRCDARGHELRLEALSATGTSAMTEGKRIETQALATSPDPSELARDAPIALCITLANFTLTLAELSALKPGEVLSTGRAIGEHALLEASGHAIARGELCEIEGEIGLRVLELLR